MKKIHLGMVLVFLYAFMSAMGTTFYVATNGSDSNSGASTSSPFATLEHAVSVVSAGDYIYLRGGTYTVSSSPIVITTNGTSGSNIHVYAYSGETPVLQFNNNENSSNRGVVMDGDYWHWKGITFEKAGDNGMLLSGNNNTIENCIFRSNHDTGLQLSRYSSSASSISQWPSDNLIIGCEAYDNKDSGNENADGFAAKLTCGTGNVFQNCVAHHNIDDGWDLYTKSATGPIGIVKFENCIAHNNGTLTDGVTSGGGDKNGFKLGSSSNTVDHILIRCIAYNNGHHGFTDNGNTGSIKFYNLTSYNNAQYNYHTRDNSSHVFRNCISLGGGHTDRIVGDAPTDCNGLNDSDTQWSISVNSSDFQTLNPGSNSDPTANGFLQLSSSSALIDAGRTVSGVSYNGSAPDLGAIESGGSTCTPTSITPYVQIDGGSWNQTASATVDEGGSVKFGPQPTSGGSWSWSGPNGFSATSREVTISNIQTSDAGNYVTTYTNSGSCTSTQTFAVTVNGTTTNPATLTKHGSGSSTQSINLGDAIEDFYYSWTDATSATVSGMPSGISTNVDNTNQTISFSGTPTETGTFGFTVTTTGSTSNATKTGTITVNGTVSTITIQENETGFVSVNGTIDTNHLDYTGSGFANTTNSLGTGIDWTVNIPSSGDYVFVWRYSNGGSADRTAQLQVNSSVAASGISFPVTSDWDTWSETSSVTVNLSAGDNTIRLEASTADGLSNIDYIEITGNSPVAVSRSALIYTSEAGNKVDEQLFTVYPSVFTDEVHIRIAETSESGASISVVNMMGKQVYEETTHQSETDLLLGNLSSGIYIVNIRSAGKVYSHKIIKR